MHRFHFGTSEFGKENQAKDEKLRTLQFLVDMGATEAHENEPINRFVANSNVDKPRILNNGSEYDESYGHYENTKTEALNKISDQIHIASDVKQLKVLMENFDQLSSPKLSKKFNFAFGSQSSKVMVLCKPPGHQELTEGKIFSGERGIIFEKMFKAIGLSVTDNSLYAAPIFPWRLTPNKEKAEIDMNLIHPFVLKHITIISPQILVLMAGEFNKLINGDFLSLNEPGLHKDSKYVKIFRLSDPGRLIDFPSEKKLAWETLKEIKNYIENGKVQS